MSVHGLLKALDAPGTDSSNAGATKIAAGITSALFLNVSKFKLQPLKPTMLFPIAL